MRLLALAFLVAVTVQRPLVPVGQGAPAFVGTDDRGGSHDLTKYRGKFVVLEWHEKGCPYVAKHYRSGQMQRLQEQWVDRGVVWLLVNSSSEGTHSYLTPEDSRAYFAGLKSAATAALLDVTGRIGKAYGVTTALHMVIIDPAGKVVYNGAIDDQPKTEASSLQGAKNYVEAALTEALAGKPITTSVSVPYGCEVHYAPNR